MSQTENWSEYWQNEGASGEVFVNQQGEKHQALAAFWHSQLTGHDGPAKMIDLACGAGSVFADLPQQHAFELHAADISPAALSQLNERLPEVETHVCSADNLPFESGTFDLVVSQFGIEYAGHQGFYEAARIVKPGGKLVVLCHIEDGYIDARNKAELEGAKLALETDFIGKAESLTRAVYSGNQVKFTQAADQFVLAEPLLAQYAEKHPNGVHAHLYHGFKQLFSKHQSYAMEDVLGWLEGMKAEVDKNILRLEEMRRAANGPEDLSSIQSQLQAIGMQEVSCQPFVLPNHQLPVAWQLIATRS